MVYYHAISRVISIHAPREGGDIRLGVSRVNTNYFNPRPPRGGRQLANLVGAVSRTFQSTPPARGATEKGLILLLD